MLTVDLSQVKIYVVHTCHHGGNDHRKLAEKLFPTTVMLPIIYIYLYIHQARL